MKQVTLKSATGKKDSPEYKEIEYQFNDPESLKEAVEMWGEKKVFELSIAQAHTDSINAKRNELKGKETGTLTLGRSVAEAIKKAKETGDKETIAALEALLGVPLS